MTDYNSGEISGIFRKHERANCVVIRRPTDETANAEFHMEEVMTMPDNSVVRKQTNAIIGDMSSMSEAFNLLNPADDSVVKQVTMSDVFVMLYSLHRYLASKVD